MTLYNKLIIVSRDDLSIIFNTLISEMDITSDYRGLKDTSQVTTLESVNNKYLNDIALVKDNLGNTIYEGVITEVDDKQIIMQPLLNIFDVDFLDNSDLTNVGVDLKSLLTRLFITSSDTFLNIPYLTINNNITGVLVYSFYNESTGLQTTNLVELFINLFTKLNIVLKTTININTKKLILDINYINEPKLLIKENQTLSNVTISSISIPINRVIFVDDTNNRIVENYYLLNDNSITNNINNLNRLKPVKIKYQAVKVAEAPDYYTLAKQELVKDIYSHEIEMSILNTVKWIDLNSIYIGRKIMFNYNNTFYDTIVSGIKNDGTSIVVKMGFARSLEKAKKILGGK